MEALEPAVERHAENFAGWVAEAISNLHGQAMAQGLTDTEAVAAVRAALLVEVGR